VAQHRAREVGVVSPVRCRERGCGGAEHRDAVALFIGGCIMTELEKLPHPQISKGRSMGPEKSLDQKIQGSGCIFQAALRAVPHVLMKHDSKLSAKHQATIAAWWSRTENLKEHPEFQLIIRARNQILKDGSFESWASSWEGTSEPGI
jgi:hypothetical protein